MRSVEFHPEAQDELVSAVHFYERQTEGLGLDFILMVQRTYERIQESPVIGRRFGRHLRRLLVPKFPYGLVYRIEPERIYPNASKGGLAGGSFVSALPSTGSRCLEAVSKPAGSFFQSRSRPSSISETS